MRAASGKRKLPLSAARFFNAAVANAWAAKGRHLGWVVRSVVVGLAAVGL
ncbi:MAG: hypothetical protein KGJ79_09335 [Alphaproteobacteria bacterium]|nr:hypothetical protein [Alphaproteobacteria bacterium]MDE2495615.1 hypothetical protein [Alphaproteobacteria bacterium]